MKITMKLETNRFVYSFNMFPTQGDQIYLNNYTTQWLGLGIGYSNNNFYLKRFHERLFKH